uniref:CCHC-type domain-containing protein n=1 Tax=Tanacetum cinerariifolium TaxID=118510 RepID=A0A6L2M132_TANCI|nr:hypothetical protein [Tanacetum cinerariifolium]
MQLPSHWQCAPKCNNCKKYGHATRECRVNVNNNNNRVQNTGTCFECREPGHFKKNCLKLKNNGNDGRLMSWAEEIITQNPIPLRAMQRNSTNGDGSHSFEGGPTRPVQSVRACSYSDFMKCQPLNFRGTEGVVGLSRWYEKIESLFHISGCAIENQVKFMTCTMLDASLTWWNGHIRTLGHDDAYAMTWETLKKKMADKYYPRGEIKKLEIKLWNLKEKEKVDKYIGGLPYNIYENVMSARPKTLDETIELANDLIDQKLRTYAESDSIFSYQRDKPTTPSVPLKFKGWHFMKSE